MASHLSLLTSSMLTIFLLLNDNFVFSMIYVIKTLFFFFFHAFSGLLSDFQEIERSQLAFDAPVFSLDPTNQEPCRITTAEQSTSPIFLHQL